MRKLTKIDNGFYKFSTKNNEFFIERVESPDDIHSWWLLKRIDENGNGEIIEDTDSFASMMHYLSKMGDERLERLR